MRVALIAVFAVTLSLSACSADEKPSVAMPTAPIIAPGRPGEPARTLSPSEAAVAVPVETPNAVDVIFMQNMISHHRQALDMAALAPTRADSDKLKGLASRIKDVQGPEIQFMTSWLQQQGQKVPDHHAAHTDMPGMATPEQIEALKAASGKDFDRLFLQLMIAHHEGALKMAEQALVGGSHQKIEEVANDITATQNAEIRRMLEMSAAMSG